MRSVRSSVAAVLVTVLALVALTGCFTGKRAHFADAGTTADTTVSDPAIQAVLTKLETVNSGSFTAAYTVITKFGNTTTAATVAQTSPVAQSVTIGHVRFLYQTSGSQTCELTTGACQTGMLDQQVSDIQLTHGFAQAAPALKLRQDANTMVSAAAASTKTIAGQNATCVEVFFAAGSKTYCVLDNGLLAQQDTPDLRIDLTALTTGADDSLFTATTVAAG